MVDSVTDADIPEGISPDAATSWPSRELIDSYLGGQHELFSWRPGEVVQPICDDADGKKRNGFHWTGAR